MVQVTWADQARHDLKEVFHYYNTFSQEVAISYAEELIKAGNRLEMMPEMGPKEPMLNHLNQNYRYVLVLRRYKLVYLYENNSCTILMIWDCKRNPIYLQDNNRFIINI